MSFLRTTGLGLVLALAAGAGWAETPEEFYAGKTVTLTVGAAPGGFADSIARAFVTKFQDHLPGHPNVIVVNKPGAAGMVAASQLQTSEEKDGTVIGFMLGNVLTTPLVTGKEAQFDPRKVQWIGSLRNGDYPYALFVFDSSPVQSVDELLAGKEMTIGATSYTNFNRVFPALMNQYLGTQMNIVSGYKGSGEVYLALERGEVDGWSEGSHAIVNTNQRTGVFVAEGRMKPLALMGAERSEMWPDLPTLNEMLAAHSDDSLATDVANFLYVPSKSGRPLAVPAEVPADRVAALRVAFEATINDPGFVPYMKDALKTPIVDSISAEALSALVEDVYTTPDPVLAEVRGFMSE